MKNLIAFFLLFTCLEAFSQDFIRDSIKIEGNGISSILKLGITTPMEVQKLFPKSKSKTKKKRFGKTYAEKTVTVYDKLSGLAFYFKCNSENKTNLKSIEATLSSIIKFKRADRFKSGDFCFNDFLCFSSSREELEQKLIDQGEEQLVLESKMDSENDLFRSYWDLGFGVAFSDSSSLSTIESFMWNESNRVRSRNYSRYEANKLMKDSPEIAEELISKCISINELKNNLSIEDSLRIGLSKYLTDDFSFQLEDFPFLELVKNSNGNEDVIFKEFRYSDENSEEIILVNFSMASLNQEFLATFKWVDYEWVLLNTKIIDN